MDLERIKALRHSGLTQTLDKRDTILYALGLGYGEGIDDLPFVYEKRLKAVPSLASMLCHPGFWAQKPEYGIDWVKILHAEQAFTIHAPLPATGVIGGESRVAAVEDKGPKGALLHQEKSLLGEDGTLLATVRSTLLLRANGGEGGFGELPPAARPLPDRAPDRVAELPISARAALIYRLSGDWNPLHADPEIAAAAGFERPILHGLCTMGMACRAALAEYCRNDPNRMGGMFVRFSRPVFPGETLRIEFFETDEEIRFRAIAAERDTVVLDRCSVALR